MRSDERPVTGRPFRKTYTVAIDTVPLPESPQERMHLAMRSVTPVVNEIIQDAMRVAIGTWPTPELPRS